MTQFGLIGIGLTGIALAAFVEGLTLVAIRDRRLVMDSLKRVATASASIHRSS